MYKRASPNNNLINPENRVDGAPKLPASLGTRIKFFHDGHLKNSLLRDVLTRSVQPARC